MIKQVGNYGVSVPNVFVCLHCRFQARLQRLQRPTRQLSRHTNIPVRNADLRRVSIATIEDSFTTRPQSPQAYSRYASTTSKKKAITPPKQEEAKPSLSAPAVAHASEDNESTRMKKKGKTPPSGKGDSALTETLSTPLSVQTAQKRATILSRRQERRKSKRLATKAVHAKIAGTLVRKTPAVKPIVVATSHGETESEGKQKAQKPQKRAAEDLEKEVEDEILKATNPLKGRSLKEALAAGDDNWASLIGTDLKLEVIEAEQPPVPTLSRGLERVLFNSGVHRVRDPHTRVYNFDPDLEKLMSVKEFDFNSLRPFMPPSTDAFLTQIATEQNKKYVGSTSSMTGVLKHFHYLLSKWREITTDMLSRSIKDNLKSFTKLNRGPDAIFLRWKNGTYAVDADKEYDSANVLSLMGKYMELLLTEDKKDFEKRRIGKSHLLTEEDRSGADSFHYSTLGDFVIRSQLDAQDKRLPGSGMFDLKTRAVIPIRMDTKDFEWGMGYEIRYLQGEWESFEREYYDMIRSTMLKYSLQVRMGRMDGIFVAYHNIARIFGFQYISLEEMDYALHGQTDKTLGDQEFLLSLSLLNKVFDKATKKFPEQTIRFHFETREALTPFMYIFAEPVTDAEANMIQTKNKKKIEEWERDLLGRKSEEELNADAREKENTTTQPVSQVSAEVIEETLNAEEGVIEAGVLNENVVQKDAGERSTSSTETPAINDISGVQKDESYESTTDADAEFINALPPGSVENNKPMLAMLLSTKSQQNGNHVNRPKDLSASDTWKLKYSLTEVAKDTRAHTLYEACKLRRSKLFAESSHDDGDPEVQDHFRDILKEKAAQGRAWRKEQDELEAPEATHVSLANVDDFECKSINKRRTSSPTTSPKTVEAQVLDRAERQAKQMGLETWRVDDTVRTIASRMVSKAMLKFDPHMAANKTINVDDYLSVLYGENRTK